MKDGTFIPCWLLLGMKWQVHDPSRRKLLAVAPKTVLNLPLFDQRSVSFHLPAVARAARLVLCGSGVELHDGPTVPELVRPSMEQR